MLTLFTVPKPFAGHIDVIQRNAIASWRKLDPVCEIILCGNEVGTKEVADRFAATWLADIACNQYGTPLLDSVFERVHAAASHPTLCYVNADIILLHDFMEAVERIEFPTFLLVGQRWDLDTTEVWEFGTSDWEGRLRHYVSDHGTLHPATGSDYFVFPRDSNLWQLPPFAVGRPVWDNWLIHRARQLGVPVVDITPVVTVVHQNHDYDHVPEGSGRAWQGPEADVNRELAGGWKNVFTLAEATHVMTREGVLSKDEG
ncbi:MAG: hypothetical protein WBE26_00225 [Phycisphaerae bacterium]